MPMKYFGRKNLKQNRSVASKASSKYNSKVSILDANKIFYLRNIKTKRRF